MKNILEKLAEHQDSHYILRKIQSLLDNPDVLCRLDKNLHRFFSQQPYLLRHPEDREHDSFAQSVSIDEAIYGCRDRLLIEKIAEEIQRDVFRENYRDADSRAIMSAFYKGLIDQEQLAGIMEYITLKDSLGVDKFKVVQVTGTTTRKILVDFLKDAQNSLLLFINLNANVLNRFYTKIEREESGLFFYLLENEGRFKLETNLHDDYLKYGVLFKLDKHLLLLSPKLRRLLLESYLVDLNSTYHIKYLPYLGRVSIDDIEQALFKNHARHASFSINAHADEAEIHFIGQNEFGFSCRDELSKEQVDCINEFLDKKLEALFLTHAFFIMENKNGQFDFIQKVKGKKFIDLQKVASFKGFRKIREKGYHEYFSQELTNGKKYNCVKLLKEKIQKDSRNSYSREFNFPLTYSPRTFHDIELHRVNKYELFMHDIAHNHYDNFAPSLLLDFTYYLVELIREATLFHWDKIMWALVDVGFRMPEEKTVRDYFKDFLIYLEREFTSDGISIDDDTDSGLYRMFVFILTVFIHDLQKSPDVWSSVGLDCEEVKDQMLVYIDDYALIYPDSFVGLSQNEKYDLLFKLIFGNPDADRRTMIKKTKDAYSKNCLFFTQTEGCLFDTHEVEDIVPCFLNGLRSNTHDQSHLFSDSGTSDFFETNENVPLLGSEQEENSFCSCTIL